MTLVFFLLALGAIAGLFAPRFKRWRPFAGAPDVGSAEDAAGYARWRAKCLIAAGKADDATLVNLGGIGVPIETLNQPVALVGAPKTGKSAEGVMLYWSLRELMDRKPGRTRIVWLDVKNERPSFLHATLPEGVPLYVLNPLDRRSMPIDWSGCNRSEAWQLAFALVPPVESDNAPFFRNWARLLLWSTIFVFLTFARRARRRWLLADALAVCADERCLKSVLSLSHETRSLYRAALRKSARSSGDVFSTLRSIVQEFADVAIAERQAPEPRFDIRRFLREDAVAVLGLTPTGSQAVLPIYAVLLQRLIEEARMNADPTDRLILLLDEVALLGPRFIDTLLAAGCIGRSSGVHVITTTQSVEFLRSSLGAAKADAFLASCETLLAHRAASRATAEYCAGRFGEQKGYLTTVTDTFSNPHGSTSYVETVTALPTVMPETILHLPLADPEADAIEYVAVSPVYGPIHVRTRFTAAAATPQAGDFPNYDPRRLGSTQMPRFTLKDAEDLGLPMTDRLVALFTTPARRK
jgi:hypothetical protein